jgi:hypothetical protein
LNTDELNKNLRKFIDSGDLKIKNENENENENKN